MLNRGDMVLIYRNRYKGPFKYLVTRIILFFTTAWWKSEKTSVVYHAELVYDNLSDSEFRAFTMEPPKARFKDRGYNRKLIFRPKGLNPTFVSIAMDTYVKDKMGKKYDFFRLFMMGLNWIFRTPWFTDHYKNGERDICSEMAARFYDRLNYPCSYFEPNTTTPDDIYDFCRTHPDEFEAVYDDRA